MMRFCRSDFWENAANWPTFDPPGYVFLARAVDRVGQALFGNDWTGTEPGQEPIYNLPPERISAVPFEIKQACALRSRLLAQQRPQLSNEAWAEADRLLRERNKSALGIGADSKYEPIGSPFMGQLAKTAWRQTKDFTDEEWANAWRLNQTEKAEQAPLLARWTQVQREIARGCLEGRLAFALRMESGEMPLGKPEWWNNDKWVLRFITCEMTPSNLSTAHIARDNFQKIFLTRESLEAFVVRLASGEEAPSASWAPSITQHLKDWCVQLPPEAEARLRLKRVEANPSDRSICRTLAHMWHEAGREICSWKSIEQYRVKARKIIR